jgi:hypothetical protein
LFCQKCPMSDPKAPTAGVTRNAGRLGTSEVAVAHAQLWAHGLLRNFRMRRIYHSSVTLSRVFYQLYQQLSIDRVIKRSSDITP